MPIVLVSLLFATVIQAGVQDQQALIREALSAAPPEVAKTAIVKNWDGAVLKPGSGAYTCYPTRDSMKKRGKMSMCLDKTWQVWADAWQNKKLFKANEVGIAYMLAGDVGSSNTNPYADGPTSNNQWVEPGPHLMVIVPNPVELEGISTDPYNGGPLRNVEGHTLCSHHGAHRQAPVSWARIGTCSYFRVFAESDSRMYQLCLGLNLMHALATAIPCVNVRFEE